MKKYNIPLEIRFYGVYTKFLADPKNVKNGFSGRGYSGIMHIKIK